MDLFESQGGSQVHDYNPGISTGGLFWTIAVPRSAVSVDLQRAAQAEFVVRNLAITDQHDLMNALHHGPGVPATVSFAVNWNGIIRGGLAGPVRNTTNGFAGEFFETDATLGWSSTQAGFSFVSTSATRKYAVLASERNGLYFK